MGPIPTSSCTQREFSSCPASYTEEMISYIMTSTVQIIINNKTHKNMLCCIGCLDYIFHYLSIVISIISITFYSMYAHAKKHPKYSQKGMFFVQRSSTSRKSNGFGFSRASRIFPRLKSWLGKTCQPACLPFRKMTSARYAYLGK